LQIHNQPEQRQREELAMSFGPVELVVILIIVILIFGVGRLGRVGGELGSAIKNFREGLKTEVERAEKSEEKKSEEKTA
jgi:sec-independent protein translocase protein TatA